VEKINYKIVYVFKFGKNSLSRADEAFDEELYPHVKKDRPNGRP
jgi:hypothetical protein